MTLDMTDIALNLAFRQATPTDIARVVSLVESAYRGEASRRGWTTEADFLDGQRIDAGGVGEFIAKPDSRVLLGECQGRLLACCQIEKHAGSAWFGMFSVVPVEQGAGLGRAMLAEAERVARDEWQCHQMRMAVIGIRAELIAWYERRGYRRSGESRPFPYGDERFGIPRRDDLRFEILVKSLVQAASARGKHS